MAFDNFFKFIMLIGGALTLLMSFYLWFFSRKFFSSRVLGVLTFSWALLVGLFVIQSKSFFIRFPHVFGIASSLPLLYFPLMYIYIRSYLYKDARYVKKYVLHFIPSVAYLIAMSPFFIKSSEAKIALITAGIPEWIRLILRLSDLVIIGQGIIYTLLSVHILQHFQYFREKQLTKAQHTAVRWLQQFVIVNALLWAIGTSGAFMEIIKLDVPFDLFKVYYLGLIILAIWMGWFTLKRPYLFSADENIRSIISEKDIIKKDTTEIKNKEISSLLDFLEEEKPYLKNDMSMQDLVDGTGISRHRISELFNTELKKSFYDIINEYRTKEAMRLIDEKMHEQHKIHYLATEAGFNSKATFNRIFKKQTGFTPTEYINSKVERVNS